MLGNSFGSYIVKALSENIMSKKGKVKLWIFVALFIGLMISISYLAVRDWGLEYFSTNDREQSAGLLVGFGLATLIISYGFCCFGAFIFDPLKRKYQLISKFDKKIGDFGDLLIFMLIVNLLLISYISIPKYTNKNINNNEIEGEFDREEFQPLE